MKAESRPEIQDGTVNEINENIPVNVNIDAMKQEIVT